jgi:PAS domain S-box-containing protein
MSPTASAPGLECQLGELADRLVRQEETTRRLEAALNVLVKLPIEPDRVDSALVRTPRTVLIPTPPEFELRVKKSGKTQPPIPADTGADPADADVLWATAGFIPDPLVGLDAAGRVRVWNPAAELAFGWPAADVIGFPPPFVPDDKRAEERQLLGTACRGGAVRDVATVRRKRDGTLVRVRVSAAGHAGGAAFVVKPETTPPLRPALHALPKDEETDAAAGIKRVLAALVHDLNNLFTVVCGGSEVLIERHATGDPRRAEAEMVHAAGVHAARLVQQLAGLATDVPYTPGRADLNTVVKEMTPVMRGVLGASRELTVETTSQSAVVAADPSRLSQALLNLAANARDAMPAGGTVHVTTGLDESNRVVLTVRDTGPGVDPVVRATMFDRNVSTKDKARGLGLATVAEVVAQAGGRIAVESAPGQGTSILLTLPRAGENDTVPYPVS